MRRAEAPVLTVGNDAAVVGRQLSEPDAHAAAGAVPGAARR